MATDFFKRPMRVLHLEDNDNDLILVDEMLRSEGLKYELVTAKTRNDFEVALNQATLTSSSRIFPCRPSTGSARLQRPTNGHRKSRSSFFPARLEKKSR